MSTPVAEEDLKRSPKITEEQRAQIIALREAGHMTDYEIAIAVGVSDQSVANVLFKQRKQQAAR